MRLRGSRSARSRPDTKRGGRRSTADPQGTGAPLLDEARREDEGAADLAERVERSVVRAGPAGGEIGSLSGIVRSIEPSLGARELRLVVQLRRDDFSTT